MHYLRHRNKCFLGHLDLSDHNEQLKQEGEDR